MSLGERIKEQRKSCGMSQEKLAELVGVSRQAVTKWETDQSAPSTEKLFKLAEIFGTSVDLLIKNDEQSTPTPAEQIYYMYKMEQEQKRAALKAKLKKNLIVALCIAAGYILFYLIGRVIWCDRQNCSFLGWLFYETPRREHSYLYGWLLSSYMFYITAAISIIPSLIGKHLYSITTLSGFTVGFLAGVIFGPNPEGAAIGHDHYGWAIWGVIFFASVIVGIVLEILKKRGLIK
jgi:transcriptional regulator with XRE-family HTH domain